MKKNLVYLFSDGGDCKDVVFTNIETIIEIIKYDIKELREAEVKEREYTITLGYMTEEEINALPEFEG